MLSAETNPATYTTTETYRYVAARPFRFSTKWTDAESGLSYCGLNYSGDFIEEEDPN